MIYKLITSLTVLLLYTIASAQDNYSNEELKIKNDSILAEANLLYKLEKAAWTTTDLFMKNKSAEKIYGSYLAYQTNNTTKVIILNKEKDCVMETVFLDNFEKPSNEILINRKLTENEKKLLSIKNTITSQIINNLYKVRSPEGYSLNLIVLPFGNQYKMYIITGTSQPDIIPFGNDYLFYADESGTITSWKRFHFSIIPAFSKDKNGNNLLSSRHTNLKTEPFITATDICTFKLYGSLSGQNEFTVYSPALSKSFKYLLNEDRIEIKDEI